MHTQFASKLLSVAQIPEISMGNELILQTYIVRYSTEQLITILTESCLSQRLRETIGYIRVSTHKFYLDALSVEELFYTNRNYDGFDASQPLISRALRSGIFFHRLQNYALKWIINGLKIAIQPKKIKKFENLRKLKLWAT